MSEVAQDCKCNAWIGFKKVFDSACHAWILKWQYLYKINRLKAFNGAVEKHYRGQLRAPTAQASIHQVTLCIHKVILCIDLNPFKQDHYSDDMYCLVQASVTSSIRTTSNGMPIVRKTKVSLIYLTGISSIDIWTCVAKW